MLSYEKVVDSCKADNKKPCKGETFFKDYPFFLLHDKTILKQEGTLRLGKIKLVDTDKEMFLIEDEFFSTRYEDYGCALEHFEHNIRIGEEIKKQI